MEEAGPIIGMPFSWEGTAFFLEAIALGLFLYGWDKLPRWIHFGSGVLIGISGVLSALFVVCANAWMNCPMGVRFTPAGPRDIDPWAAMWNPAAVGQATHMILGAFAATGFAVAGIHALALLRKGEAGALLHRRALAIALFVGAVAALLQPLSGDRLAKAVAQRQPAKLAAMEALFETSKPAPLLLLGLPVESEARVRGGLYVPRMLSFLAHGDFDAKVTGLDRVARAEWPPVAVTHLAFDLMVGLGSFLAAIGLFGLLLMWRRKEALFRPPLLWLLLLSTPLGFVAVEAGWVVTEVGRQPWIIYGVMKTADAVTPMPGLVVPMLLFCAVYVFLSFVVLWLLGRQFRHAP
jgi:cytochrome d ubiquinol oxidase subunit I